MTILYKLHQQLKESPYGADQSRQEKMLELRSKGRSLIMFAGMVRFLNFTLSNLPPRYAWEILIPRLGNCIVEIQVDERNLLSTHEIGCIPSLSSSAKKKDSVQHTLVSFIFHACSAMRDGD